MTEPPSKQKARKESRSRAAALSNPVVPPPASDHVSWYDIKVVQNLIERCLQRFMTRSEIVTALQVQANIEPAFTNLVWSKLEEQNPDFFFSYNVRLRMRDQVNAFTFLYNQQHTLIQNVQQTMDTISMPAAMRPVEDINGLAGGGGPWCHPGASVPPPQPPWQQGLDHPPIKTAGAPGGDGPQAAPGGSASPVTDRVGPHAMPGGEDKERMAGVTTDGGAPEQKEIPGSPVGAQPGPDTAQAQNLAAAGMLNEAVNL